MNRQAYADAIVADLAGGVPVYQGDSALKLEGSRYVMTKTRGVLQLHALEASCTDALRLLAHWEGYCGRVFDESITPPQMVQRAPLRAGAFDWWDNPCPRKGW